MPNENHHIPGASSLAARKILLECRKIVARKNGKRSLHERSFILILIWFQSNSPPYLPSNLRSYSVNIIHPHSTCSCICMATSLSASIWGSPLINGQIIIRPFRLLRRCFLSPLLVGDALLLARSGCRSVPRPDDSRWHVQVACDSPPASESREIMAQEEVRKMMLKYENLSLLYIFLFFFFSYLNAAF